MICLTSDRGLFGLFSVGGAVVRRGTMRAWRTLVVARVGEVAWSTRIRGLVLVVRVELVFLVAERPEGDTIEWSRLELPSFNVLLLVRVSPRTAF